MSESSPRRTAAIVVVVYVAVVVAVLFVSRAYADRLPPAQTRINETYAFPRVPGKSCEEIGDLSRLALYVKGMDTGLRAVGCTDEPPIAAFSLQHDAATRTSPATDRAVWNELVGNPLETSGKWRERSYDIRWLKDDNTTEQLAPPHSSFRFYVFAWWSPAAIAVVLLVWGLLIYLARHSALLRDPDPGASKLGLEQRTFSLAKTQLAWWFAIIFASFVFLWLVTGEMPSLSGQALSLLGISGVTTMASLGISANRTPPDGTSGVFFRDLLSDASGITIQRFQMLVMTIALGLMFLIQVATRLTMPEFDASLLTLLGISAGTYVGLKIPEAKSGGSGEAATDSAKSGYSPTN